MNSYSLILRNWKEIYRDPVSILLGLAMPVLMLFIFSSINKNVPLEIFSPQYLTPGIVIFSFTFLIMFSAVLLAKDKQSSFLIRLFTTPLKPADFIMSYIVPFLPLALLQVAVCLITGTLLGGNFNNILPSLAIYFIIAFICITIGVAIGSSLTLNQVSGIGSLLMTTIGLVSGVWMDLKMVGGIFEKIGYALPFVHAVEILKNLMKGDLEKFSLSSFTVLVCYALLFFLLAIFSFMNYMRKR